MRVALTPAPGFAMALAVVLCCGSIAAGASGTERPTRNRLIVSVAEAKKAPPDQAEPPPVAATTEKAVEKNDRKPFSRMKRMFKDFRAGSCKPSSATTAPASSSMPRGEAAMSVCRP